MSRLPCLAPGNYSGGFDVCIKLHQGHFPILEMFRDETIDWVGKTKVNLMVVLLTKGLAAISSFTLSIRVLETKFVVIIIKNKKTKNQEQSEC